MEHLPALVISFVLRISNNFRLRHLKAFGSFFSKKKDAILSFKFADS